MAIVAPFWMIARSPLGGVAYRVRCHMAPAITGPGSTQLWDLWYELQFVPEHALSATAASPLFWAPKNVLCTQFGVDFRVKGDPLNLPEKTIKFSSKMVLAKCPVGKEGEKWPLAKPPFPLTPIRAGIPAVSEGEKNS